MSNLMSKLMPKQLREVKVVAYRREATELQDEKLTLFEKQAVKVLEEAFMKNRKGEKVATEKLLKKLKSIWKESIVTEFYRHAAELINVTTKRKLYGAPDKNLLYFTIIESRRKPEGYFISFKLQEKLPKNTELKQIVVLFNLLALNAYNKWNIKQICGEVEDDVNR